MQSLDFGFPLLFVVLEAEVDDFVGRAVLPEKILVSINEKKKQCVCGFGLHLVEGVGVDVHVVAELVGFLG